MGGEERVERQHASGPADRARAHRAALRRRQLPRDRRASPARAHLRRRRRARRLPARERGGRARAGSTAAARWSRATTSPSAAAPPTPRSGRRSVYAERMAHELRLPLVRLVDGTGGGGSVKTLETMGFTYVPAAARLRRRRPRTSRDVPVVAAALGPVAGLGAARVVASHFSVIVRGTAQLFVAGPPVVAAAMGESPDKEELGGARAPDRAPARSTTRPPTRTTPSPRSAASSPTCRGTCGRRRRVAGGRATPPTAARRSCSRSCRATGASRYEMRRILEARPRPRLVLRDRARASGAR